MAFEAGPYSWSWSVDGTTYSSLGVVEDSPSIRVTQNSLPVTGDNLGDTIQDVIYRGHNMYLSLTFKEWVPANLRAVWAYLTTGGTSTNAAFAAVRTPGALASSFSVALQASRIGVTPSNGGQTYVFHSCVVNPGFDLEYTLGSALRVLPVQFLILPKLINNVPTFYTVT